MKIYGRKGKSIPIPDSYDQSTLLTTFNGKDEIATGKHKANAFHLMKGAWIKKSSHEHGNSGVNEIKKQLLRERLLLENPINGDYYLLKEDIGLYSPSTAARLVHGTNRSGNVDWIHSGIKLGELLRK